MSLGICYFTRLTQNSERSLPEQLSDEALKVIISKHIEAQGISSLKEIGKLMGAVLIECEGVADGKRINTLAKELLS